MPVFYQQDIDADTKLAIWRIAEAEQFFQVPLQREITHPHKRLQHLAGRYLLKYLFPDFPTELIRIADTRKPFLEDEAYHFSISHCGDYAAVIVSKKDRVGIDVEVISDKPARIMHKFLDADELEVVKGETSNVRTEAASSELHAARIGSTSAPTSNLKLQTTNHKLLTLFWSAKEAMFKWWGKGQIDFSEMLKLSGRINEDVGILEGRFIKEELDLSFPIHYKFFPGIVMAWVQTEPEVF